jgi:hypothetical protein
MEGKPLKHALACFFLFLFPTSLGPINRELSGAPNLLFFLRPTTAFPTQYTYTDPSHPILKPVIVALSVVASRFLGYALYTSHAFTLKIIKSANVGIVVLVKVSLDNPATYFY